MPNDNLISRSALLDKLTNELNRAQSVNVSENVLAAFRIAINYVKAVRSVDAEPVRHGKYEFIGMSMMVGTRRLYFGTCIECKERIIFESEHKNYCPNCGAKMDKEE